MQVTFFYVNTTPQTTSVIILISSLEEKLKVENGKFNLREKKVKKVRNHPQGLERKSQM